MPGMKKPVAMPSQSNKGGATRGLERAAEMSGRTMPSTGKPLAYKKGGMVFKPCAGCPSPAKCKAMGKCMKKAKSK